MKFSCILGNPPYMGNLHLKIINTVINHLTEDGVASFIHPARWLQDPLAEYKKGSDKVKFKNIVERLDDVKMIDIKTIHNKFGIIHNSDLMISTLYNKPSDKVINLYDGMPQEATDVILSYSKEHNLAQVDEKNKVDGWRCQIMDVIPVQNYADSNNTRKRTANLFSMNEKVVFYNGFDEDGVEWMDTRKHTNYGKVSTTPFPHSIKFKTKEEALNFQSSCNTKFYCNIMYLLKLDMNTPLKFLPWMKDYSHTWTDEDYCKFFGDLGMSEECQKWMCREVSDYRIKDFINYIKFDDSKNEEAIKNKWRDKETGKEMHWQICIGNPPYGMKKKGETATLHLQIMNSVIKFCTDKMTFIMPSAPITRQLKKDSIWYKMFKEAVCTDVEIVSKEMFPNTTMDNTAIYYCDRKANPDTDFCIKFEVDNKIYNAIDNIYHKLFIDKMNNKKQLKSFMIYGTQSKEKDFDTVVKNTKDNYWYLNINGANGAFGAIWISPVLEKIGVLTKDEEIDFCKTHNKTKNILECKTKEYGDNLKKLMLNGLVLRYSLWLSQSDRHIYQGQFKYVPNVDYTNIHNDEELLFECGFSNEEIEKVMAYLRDFDFTQSRNDIVRDFELKPDSSSSGSEPSKPIVDY